jgi:hypothetical protein
MSGNVPSIITAPIPPKIIKKGKYDTSVWIDILNEKYQQPELQGLRLENKQLRFPFFSLI